jgi:hypothetical protein
MRSEPSVEVSCDNCVASVHIGLADDLRDQGWVTVNGKDYCPDCAIALGLVDNDEVMMEATP